MRKILVVEDENSIVTLLQFNLEQAGFTVVTALDGKTGLYLARKEKPDLIILDLMLPEMDGMEILKTLRQEQNQTPILMLTAKDEELDKILGLEMGADDYMTKPFSPREVVARVKAILRRSGQALNRSAHVSESEEQDKENELVVGELRVLPDQYEAYIRDQKLELTPKEFELLLYLIHNKGRVLSRDQLLNAVWNYDYIGDTRIVDVHISHLREKIEENTRQPRYIKTIRGLGYKLEEKDH